MQISGGETPELSKSKEIVDERLKMKLINIYSITQENLSRI